MGKRQNRQLSSTDGGEGNGLFNISAVNLRPLAFQSTQGRENIPTSSFGRVSSRQLDKSGELKVYERRSEGLRGVRGLQDFLLSMTPLEKSQISNT